MYQLCDYYEELNPRAHEMYCRGEIWLCCVPYTVGDTKINRFYGEKEIGKGRITSIDVNKVDLISEGDDPYSHTVAGEFVALCKYKVRPVVILSTRHDTDYNPWHSEDYYLIAPIYSLRKQESGEYKYKVDFIWKIARYCYPQLFYLPAEKSFNCYEAVIRFDRMVSIHKSWLRQPRPFQLTEQIMIYLNEWLRLSIYGKIDTDISNTLEEYRKYIGEMPQYRSIFFGNA